jgi:Na+/H+ antiporter NhaD/arsenite permease-like protein
MNWLTTHGGSPTDSIFLIVLTATLSNIVSNVPASMLMIQFLDHSQPGLWYVLALAATFSGNLLLMGSIANLIVLEQAAANGIEIRFGEYARAGIPVTILSLGILYAWTTLGPGI